MLACCTERSAHLTCAPGRPDLWVLRTRLAIAVAVSAMVIMSAPFVRDIRDFIKTTFPGHYVTVVVAVVALAVTAAIVAAIARIRDRRAARYGAIAAALALAVSHAWWNAQGNLEVDAVERFHFVEHGLVTFLYYRAFRALGDVSALGHSPCSPGSSSAPARNGCSGSFPGASATCATCSSTARRS